MAHGYADIPKPEYDFGGRGKELLPPRLNMVSGADLRSTKLGLSSRDIIADNDAMRHDQAAAEAGQVSSIM